MSKKILPPEYGIIGNIAIWIFGSFWFENRSESHPDSFYALIYPKYLWEFAPCGDFYSLTVMLNKAPCFLHRWLQRLLLGMKYRRVLTTK